MIRSPATAEPLEEAAFHRKIDNPVYHDLVGVNFTIEGIDILLNV